MPDWFNILNIADSSWNVKIFDCWPKLTFVLIPVFVRISITTPDAMITGRKNIILAAVLPTNFWFNI